MSDFYDDLPLDLDLDGDLVPDLELDPAPPGGSLPDVDDLLGADPMAIQAGTTAAIAFGGLLARPGEAPAQGKAQTIAAAAGIAQASAALAESAGRLLRSRKRRAR
jgi:hypothetical protein